MRETGLGRFAQCLFDLLPRPLLYDLDLDLRYRRLLRDLDLLSDRERLRRRYDRDLDREYRDLRSRRRESPLRLEDDLDRLWALCLLDLGVRERERRDDRFPHSLDGDRLSRRSRFRSTLESLEFDDCRFLEFFEEKFRVFDCGGGGVPSPPSSDVRLDLRSNVFATT